MLLCYNAIFRIQICSFWAFRIRINYYLYGSEYFHQQAKNLKKSYKIIYGDILKGPAEQSRMTEHCLKRADNYDYLTFCKCCVFRYRYMDLDRMVWIQIWIRIVASDYESGSEASSHIY
jgi:hypothetical protein